MMADAANWKFKSDSSKIRHFKLICQIGSLHYLCQRHVWFDNLIEILRAL